MKRLLIICTVLAAIIAGGILSLSALYFYSRELSSGLEQAAALAAPEPQASLYRICEIQEDWERKEPYIGLFVHEDPLLTFSEQLERCRLLLKNGQNEEAQNEMLFAAYMIRNLFHQQLPTLENIF